MTSEDIDKIKTENQKWRYDLTLGSRIDVKVRLNKTEAKMGWV